MIRAWVREGRTDAWIAHQLEVPASELRDFRRRHGLSPDSEPDTEADLRDEIEAEVRLMGSPVASSEIGRLVLDRLRRIDEVAYLRFASVHKDFQDATDFEREMAALEEQLKE